jgi:LacI family transcriptional regulator
LNDFNHPLHFFYETGFAKKRTLSKLICCTFALGDNYMAETNIRALAKELKLSIGTVSKALRDSHEISEETKKKVFALARKRNYVPNPYASSLRRKKSNTIGVVVPEVADSFFSNAIKGINHVAQKKGYHVLIYLTDESVAKEEAIIKDFASGRVDGVLMSISSETSGHRHIDYLMSKQVPIVFFDRVINDAPTTKIITDDFESSYKATTHLIERGCKRITYLSILKHISINTNRMEGYKKAMADHYMSASACGVLRCTNNSTENYKLIKNLLQDKQRPDGIIATVEKLTPPIYTVCQELHITIPDQLKIISFSTQDTAAILAPPLTTVTQPAIEMGEKAATILFKTIEHKNYKLTDENIILPSSLIVRGST